VSALGLIVAVVVAGAGAGDADGNATANATPTPTSTSTPTATANANPTEPLSPALPPLPRGEGEKEAPEASSAWFDRSHSFVSDRLLQAVGWFDDLFADGGHVEFEHNGSQLFLRQELRFEDAPRVAPRTDLRLDLRLPQLGNRFERLHLVVYAQRVAQDLADRVGTLRGGTSGQVTAPAGDPTQGSAELRYDLLRALGAAADVGAGVHVDLPPGGYLRTRLRSTFGVAPRTVARLTESGFYDTFQGFGTAMRGELEHEVAAATLLRLDGVAAVSGATRSWEWGGELSALRALGPASAVGVGAALLGHGRGGPTIDTYRLSTRLRASAFRRWLAFEVEPEVAWPLDAITLQRRRAVAASFRVEVQFGAGAANAASPLAPGGVPGMRDTP
jgi:hypothetical protein